MATWRESVQSPLTPFTSPSHATSFFFKQNTSTRNDKITCPIKAFSENYVNCSFGLSATSQQYLSQNKPVSSTFLSEQISTSQQPNEEADSARINKIGFSKMK
jgi:hypothetical protein